jgi:hypothetical protein
MFLPGRPQITGSALPRAPHATSVTPHWLFIDGVQPTIEENAPLDARLPPAKRPRLATGAAAGLVGDVEAGAAAAEGPAAQRAGDKPAEVATARKKGEVGAGRGRASVGARGGRWGGAGPRWGRRDGLLPV